jgi:hypothetical protein
MSFDEDKIYFSRAQSRAMASEYPVGDPTGGAAYGERRDPVTAAIGGAAVLGYMGSQNQADAATQSAQLQANAANQASAQQLAMFNTINAQQAPYRSVGYGALNTISGMLPGQQMQYDAQGNPIAPVTGTGYLTKPFTSADLIANLDPSYQFMREQGLGATGQAMNVGGGGSNVNLAQTKFAEDYAKTGAQQAFNNFSAQQSNIYNRLAGIAGIGQAGQTQANTAGTNAANAMGQLGVGAAGAIGAGQVGAANAYAGGLQGIGSAGTLASLLGGGGGNAYATGQQLSGLYGSSNVYGAGGGGTNYLSGPGASFMPIGE